MYQENYFNDRLTKALNTGMSILPLQKLTGPLIGMNSLQCFFLISERKLNNLRVIDNGNMGIGGGAGGKPLVVIIIASERRVGGRFGGSGHFF
jgi:hypothetical protein